MGKQELGKTILLSRQEFLPQGSLTADLKKLPPLVTSALEMCAKSQSVQGFAAACRARGVYFEIFQQTDNKEKGGPEKANDSLVYLNLLVGGNIYSETVEMKGRSFEEMEQAAKQNISLTPKSKLIGIFRFTD